MTKIPSNDKEKSVGRAWRSQLEEQLGRYDMDYLDLILFHGLSWEAFQEHVSKPGYALEAARQAQSEGLVRHVGFSSHDTAENIVQLVETGEFEAILVQFNFLDDHNLPAINAAAKAGIGVTIMGPVAGGRLGVPGAVAIEGAGMEELRIPDLALRYVLGTPGATVALSGMNAMDQIDENVASAEITAEMKADEKERIGAVLEQNHQLMDLYCTACGYCMPCPNNVNIPENFRYMNWHRVWGLTKEAGNAYAQFSEDGFWATWQPGKVVGLAASECIECGSCEPKCPQNIPIIKQLKEVAAELGSQSAE